VAFARLTGSTVREGRFGGSLWGEKEEGEGEGANEGKGGEEEEGEGIRVEVGTGDVSGSSGMYKTEKGL